MALDVQLNALAAMSAKDLRLEWQRVHRVAPPIGFGPDLIARSLAYMLQEKVAGSLPRSVAREIRRGVAELAAKSLSLHRPPPLRSGTRLTREWHGRTHHVQVVDGAFDYRDRHYRSLTAIARQITGARWSGPRFFGLTGRGAG